MKSRFTQYLVIVSAVHVGIILALMMFAGWTSFFRKKHPFIMPIEFVVEVPSSMKKVKFDSKDDVVPVRKPDTVPIADNKKAKPKLKPKKEPVKTTATASKKDSKPKSSLTEEQIRKLLAQGAKPSDHTSIPDEETIQFEIVRRTMYEAWIQPSAEEAGNKVAEVAMRLAEDGTVYARKLEKQSGSVVMDVSVMEAVNSVMRIDNLSHEFIKRHSEITISFKLEEGVQ